jgi:hypothetical protein
MSTVRSSDDESDVLMALTLVKLSAIGSAWIGLDGTRNHGHVTLCSDCTRVRSLRPSQES